MRSRGQRLPQFERLAADAQDISGRRSLAKRLTIDPKHGLRRQRVAAVAQALLGTQGAKYPGTGSTHAGINEQRQAPPLQINPAEQPVLYLALTSSTLPLYTVDEYAETLLAQRISMASGVSRVQVYGAQKYAVRVQLNPDELTARGIGVDEVQRAIEQNNVNLPVGKLYGEKQAFTIQSNGQLNNAAQYRPLIVAYKNGLPVRLEQLGRVIDSVENDKAAAWFDGVRGVILAIQRQPGTNTVEVVDNIRKMIPLLRAEI